MRSEHPWQVFYRAGERGKMDGQKHEECTIFFSIVRFPTPSQMLTTQVAMTGSVVVQDMAVQAHFHKSYT